MPNKSNAAIEFKHWGYRHASRKHFAVRGLNLRIAQGERVLLLGASGIGKSTILAGATGLLGNGIEHEQNTDNEAVIDLEGGISEGSIYIDGIPVYHAIGKVGLVLQDPDAQAIFQRVGDNVAFGPENLDVPREQIWERVDESLHAVGLTGVQLTRSVMHLSGGQMQRLALAGDLAMRPDVLLLDEPTANLDPDGVNQVVSAVSDVLRDSDTTMILVEHRAQPWVDLIDRVIVLGLDEHSESSFKQTVVVADGSVEEVFTNPTLDFASLGIWVPQQYRRPSDVIKRIHSNREPSYRADQGTGNPILTVQDLAIGRNNQAIAEHINLEFYPGQITALVGANGAGKSTLSLTLAGLLDPITGQIIASSSLQGDAQSNNPRMWSSKELATRISYVFQNPEHQFACSSVLDEVMLGPLRTGQTMEEAKERAITLLKRFHLSQYKSANPYTLSGGEKRRLTVASALAAAPKVLILDEPTFGQDRRTWMQIVTLIHDLRSDGVSIIVVTHDRDLVTALGARVVELVPQFAQDEWSTTADIDEHEVGDERVQTRGTAITVSSVNDRYEEPKASSRSPFLASLNPVFRLFGAFLASLPLLLSLDWLSASVALGIEFVLLWCIGLTPWRVIRSTWPIFIGAPGSALAVLLYGKAGGDDIWQFGWMHITQRSSMLALATGLRILAIGIPAIIAVLGIDATDLADGFSQILHLPDRFVYGGLAGMRLFSVLQDDWAALSASRRSRGLGDDHKIRTFLPQSFALLVLSIRRSTSLATAMQARGFGGSTPRSHARMSHVHARDWVFLVICTAIPVIALCVAAWCGTFSFMGN